MVCKSSPPKLPPLTTNALFYDVKAIEPPRIIPDDLALVVVRKARKGPLDHRVRVRKRTLVVRVIAAPQQAIGASK